VDLFLDGLTDFIILGVVDGSKVGVEEVLGIDVFEIFGGFTLTLFGLFVSRNGPSPFLFTFSFGTGFLLEMIFAFGALTF